MSADRLGENVKSVKGLRTHTVALAHGTILPIGQRISHPPHRAIQRSSQWHPERESKDHGDLMAFTPDAIWFRS